MTTDSRTLRDGTTTTDPRCDALLDLDPRSKAYPARAALPPTENLARRSHTWAYRGDALDQGREGACVAYAICHEIAARPTPARWVRTATTPIPQGRHDDPEIVERPYAVGLYHDAQRCDVFPGGAYLGASPHMEGTSVLAGMKVATDRGFYDGYRWCFSLADLIDSVMWLGPVVVATRWYPAMHRPGADGDVASDGLGYLKPEGGEPTGRHAYVVLGVDIDTDDGKGADLIVLNSWGPRWGADGRARMRRRVMRRLIGEAAEMAVPVGRSNPRPPR